MEKANAF
jgi:aryl-alcohol dehydrogenase-like predicted oxidoreductase